MTDNRYCQTSPKSCILEGVTDTELAALTRQELIQLAHRHAATIARLEARIQELEAQLEEARRAAKRQAAPFSKGAPKAHPKTAGRQPGHAPAHRPKPERVDHIEDAPLSSTCFACGGPVVEDRVESQYQVEIPPVQPVVTQFNVHIGHCTRCGKRAQGRHPQQTSDALGAAAVQLGPRAIALAAEVKHDLGVPYGKVQRLFETAFGLQVCRAAFARSDQRLAQCHQGVYQHLILVLQHSHAVCGDETGWKIGGHSAWLWVFTNEAVTVYTIDPTRAHTVAQRILGEDFAGVLNCDCFLAYDPLKYRQQKCLRHLLNRCGEMAESKTGRAVQFSRQVAALLRGAIHLQHRYQAGQLSTHGYQVACGHLEAALDRLLEKNLKDADNRRLAELLKKHRLQLFVFLYTAGVAPTNAEAEREIRPAVVVRKISAGNRSDVGAETHSVLASVMRTCRKHGESFIQLAMERLCHPQAALPEWLRRLGPKVPTPREASTTAGLATGPPS